MQAVSLPPRLRLIADLVPRGARLVDVGTDHAYLPVALLQERRISRAIATDLRPGPLARAAETVRRSGLVEPVDLRLGDGLAPVREGEADCVVIAGMGGETMAGILAAAPWTGAVRCVLQPMSKQEELRKFLTGQGYQITEEHLCREGKVLYTITVTDPAGNQGGHLHVKEKPFTEAELLAGRQYRGMHAPLRAEYLAELIQKTARALSGVRRSSAREGEAALSALLAQLQEMKEEWDTWQP